MKKKKINKERKKTNTDEINIKSNIINNMNDLKNNGNLKIGDSDHLQIYNCNNNKNKLSCDNTTHLYLTRQDINNLKYQFFTQTELCTYVIYLKEFRRVDILNDDKTIIKEIIKEGKGICTPKKNDYVDFLLNENNKQEYIHTILDINNLKYRGLFHILQHMKKNEISKVILKGNQCNHIYYLNHDCQKNIQNHPFYINQQHNNVYDKIHTNHKSINIKKNTSCEEHQIINHPQKSNTNHKSIDYIDDNKTSHVHNDTTNVSLNLIKTNIEKEQIKEFYIQLIDYKKSKIININSIININTSEKLLLYINQEKIHKTNDINKNIKKNQQFNIPTIDTESELIIKMSLTYLDNTTKQNIYLPICYTKNNKNIKKEFRIFYLFIWFLFYISLMVLSFFKRFERRTTNYYTHRKK